VLGVAEAEGDSEELDDSVMLRLWLTLDVEDEDGDGRALRDSDCDAVLPALPVALSLGLKDALGVRVVLAVNVDDDVGT